MHRRTLRKQPLFVDINDESADTLPSIAYADRKRCAVTDRYPDGSSDPCIEHETNTQKSASLLFGPRMARRRPKAPKSGVRQEAETFQWAPTLPGFGIRRFKSGRQTFVIQYRERGKTKRKTIGVVGVDDKRRMWRVARRHLSRVDLGHKVIDPFLADVPSDDPTLEQFAPKFLKMRTRHWAASTARTNQDALEKVILPFLGDTKVKDLERPRVMAWRDSLSARPGVANRALPVLSSMMKEAEVLGLRPAQSNPCRRIARFRTAKRPRFLFPAEIERLGRALGQFDCQAPEVCDMIRLLLLTGARRSEIERLTWGEVKDGPLQLAQSKTGPSTRYLSAEARAILGRRRATHPAPQDLQAFVFDAEGRGRRPRIAMSVWDAIREAAGLKTVRLHDLRHTFASHAVMNGVTLPTVSRLLGHALLESTEIYAHLSETSVREAGNRVGTRIARAAGFATKEMA
jgi:integrase